MEPVSSATSALASASGPVQATAVPAPPAATATAAAATAGKKKRKRDGTLDFFSPEFDPLKALRTPGVVAPLPVPPLASWAECAALLEANHVYDEMMRTIDEAAAAANAPRTKNKSAGAAAAGNGTAVTATEHPAVLAPPTPTPAPAVPAAASTTSTASRTLTSLLHSASAIAASSAAHAAVASASPSTSLAPPAAITPAPVQPAVAVPQVTSTTAAVSSTLVDVLPGGLRGSRMSAEQIRANREKAEKKSKENAELKAKQSHYMDRFTSNFPAPKPISTNMQKAKSADGPMSLLCSFHARRLRIFISIRASHSMRSVLSGYLLAFDKHWNLILHDVEEESFEWEWRKCGRHTLQQLRDQGTRFQVTRDAKRALEEQERQMTPADRSLDATGSAPLLPTPTAGQSRAASSATTDNAPLIRVEVIKRRNLRQLYVRGDSVIAVTQHRPTLYRPPVD